MENLTFHTQARVCGKSLQQLNIQNKKLSACDVQMSLIDEAKAINCKILKNNRRTHKAAYQKFSGGIVHVIEWKYSPVNNNATRTAVFDMFLYGN